MASKEKMVEICITKTTAMTTPGPKKKSEIHAPGTVLSISPAAADYLLKQGRAKLVPHEDKPKELPAKNK